MLLTYQKPSFVAIDFWAKALCVAASAGATLFPEKAGPAVVGFVVATRAIVGQTFLNHRGKG